MSSLRGISYSDVALQSLSKIPKKYRGQIVRKVDRLIHNPTPPNARLVRGVTGYEDPVYRLRSGDYRILYVANPGPQITILDVGHRKDIYQGL